MRIAQIAPLTEAVPPALYGGTERVVSWLTEELVALGHDVTLFASGDSGPRQARRLLASRAAARRRDPRPERAAHGDDRTCLSPRAGFRFPAFPPGLFSLFAVFAPVRSLRHHHARTARPARAPAPVFDLQQCAGDFDLQFPAPSAASRQFHRNRPPRPARGPVAAAAGEAVLSRLPRPHFAGKARRSRHSHRPSLRPAAQDRGQGRSCRRRLFPRDRAAPAGDARRGVHRRDRRRAKAGFPEQRHRPDRADRLARTLALS